MDSMMLKSANYRPPVVSFTLVELLAVIAITGILASLLLPVLARAKEKAKVVRVHAELYGIGLALEMYSMDNQTNPPVRVNCNSNLREDWCELPAELAKQGYLPHGPAGRDANMEDIFNHGHTYKYAAAGPQLLNGSPTAPYQLWVPTNAPLNMSGGGKYFTDPKISPVRWVIWSLGPQPNSAKSLGTYAPLSSEDWYRRTGDSGVIVRFADRNGMQFSSP
jgi:prepilin-type N-terminal cleavage/methylation domain-containing protein